MKVPTPLIEEKTSTCVTLPSLDGLLATRLVQIREGGLGVRHRAIADALLRRVPRETIAKAVLNLLHHFAQKAGGISDPTRPERRIVIALLSHTLMVRLELPPESVRRIYELVRPLLRQDFHYWLQSAAFETEKGDPELATRYLESARALPGGQNDYKVMTEWGILRLKRAKSGVGDHAAEQAGVEAVRELVRVTKQHGSASPHTYKVLATDGDRFLRTARTLSELSLKELRDAVDHVVSVGLTVCKDNSVAMEALVAYSKRQNVAAVRAPSTFPLPGPPAEAATPQAPPERGVTRPQELLAGMGACGMQRPSADA